MNHEVNNVQMLHDSAMTLFNNVVVSGECSADSILNSLNQGIENLKSNWNSDVYISTVSVIRAVSIMVIPA